MTSKADAESAAMRRARWNDRRHRVVLAGRLALLFTLSCLLGLCLFIAFGAYDRSAVVSGRSEVLAVRVAGAAFASWAVPQAEFREMPGAPAQAGDLGLDLRPGTRLRFARTGRGPLELAFEAAPGAADCPTGGRAVGLATIASRDIEVCDLAFARIALPRDMPPLTISVQGDITVGEALRAGGFRQPILLSGDVALLLRPAGLLSRPCDMLRAACERYRVAGPSLSAGDEASWTVAAGQALVSGFLRIDPVEDLPGFAFDLAANADGLRVERLKGASYVVRESLSDRVLLSPIGQAIIALTAAAGALGGMVSLLGWESGARLGALLLLPGWMGAAQAQQVYIEAREEGQALLMARADRCQAITIEHVAGRAEEPDAATIATLVGASRVLGDGRLVRRVPSVPEPLLVFEVSGALTGTCQRFTGPRSLDGVLQGQPTGQLRLVRRGGGVVTLPLTVQAVDFELFQVRLGEAAARGMSGGTVLLNGREAGLLVDVDPATGIGRVVRMDRILERLAPWFLAGGATTPPPATAVASPQAFQVVRWSVPPMSPDTSPATLERGGVWRVPAGRPADAVIALPEGSIIAGVSLSVTGLADPPRQVEVLTSPPGAERWLPAGTMAFEPGDGERHLAFPPRRHGLVMLRLFQAQPGQATMALAGIAVR